MTRSQVQEPTSKSSQTFQTYRILHSNAPIAHLKKCHQQHTDNRFNPRSFERILTCIILSPCPNVKKIQARSQAEDVAVKQPYEVVLRYYFLTGLLSRPADQPYPITQIIPLFLGKSRTKSKIIPHAEQMATQQSVAQYILDVHRPFDCLSSSTTSPKAQMA